MASSGDGGRVLAISGDVEPAALAVSGDGEPAALAVSGNGERAAVAVPGRCERAAVEVSSQGKDMLLDSLDYPCTERLRLRRLLAYLRDNICDQIYYVARARLGVIFHVEDLVEQVQTGKFREAYCYVRVYAPLDQSSDEAELLALFLEDLMAISSFAQGDIMVAGIVCDWFKNLYKRPLLSSKYPCFASLVADVLFLRSNHVRNSLDWQLIRDKAAELVEEMAYKAPELKDATHYPRGQNNLYDVMPIRSSYHRRRQLKTTGQKQSADVAKFYLQLKKRLPSTGQAVCHDRSGSRNQGEMLVALLDKALQAGQRKVHTQCHQTEYLLGGVFPLEAVLDYKCIPGHLKEQVYRLEQTSYQAMKRPMFQEPYGDAAHQGNDLKRPRTAEICLEHNQLTEGKKQAIWNLTLILRNGEGVPIKSMNKTHYRCLACGWNGGSKSGIKAQEFHLIGDKGRGIASCEMTTPRIYQLLGLPLPEPHAGPRTMPGAGKKRKRQPPRTRQVQIRGHLGQSSSNHAAPNTDPLPLDSVAGLSEVPEPVQVQEPNLHGALPGLPQEVDIVIQAPELLPGYMEVLAVLNSRRSMSSLLDALVRLVPVLEFVRPARGALHTIMECCKDSMAPGEITGMVYAPAVLEALGAMKKALSVLESKVLITGQETLNLFAAIDVEVDALEQLCLQSIHPSLPSIAPHILDASHSL